MSFKTYYLAKSVAEREVFALQAGTTRGFCNQIVYAGRQIELGLADVFVKLSAGAITLDDLPLTDRATQQRRVRDGSAALPAAEPARVEG